MAARPPPKKIKTDLRKHFRAEGRMAQDEVAERFLAGIDVHGAPLAPIKQSTFDRKTEKRRATTGETKKVGGTGLVIEAMKNLPAAVTKGGKIRFLRRTVAGKKRRIARLKAGIETGALFKSMTKRSNVKASRTGVVVKQSKGMRGKWMSLNLGRKDGSQAKRHFGGMTDEFFKLSAARTAEEFRNQIVSQMRVISKSHGVIAARRGLADYARRQAKAVRIAEQAMATKIAGYRRGEFTVIKRRGYFDIYPKGTKSGEAKFRSLLRPVN